MPLEPIIPTEEVAASQIAARMTNEVIQVSKQFNELRTVGVPARAAVAEQTLPDGRVIPARPAVQGVSAAAINNALGVANRAIFDALKEVVEG